MPQSQTRWPFVGICGVGCVNGGHARRKTLALGTCRCPTWTTAGPNTAHIMIYWGVGSAIDPMPQSPTRWSHAFRWCLSPCDVVHACRRVHNTNEHAHTVLRHTQPTVSHRRRPAIQCLCYSQRVFGTRRQKARVQQAETRTGHAQQTVAVRPYRGPHHSPMRTHNALDPNSRGFRSGVDRMLRSDWRATLGAISQISAPTALSARSSPTSQ